jgi:hypothetical protein
MKKIPPIPKLENGTSLPFKIRINIGECRRLLTGRER